MLSRISLPIHLPAPRLPDSRIVIWPFTDPDFTAKGAELRGGRGA
jgi:hypothetical protein